MRAASGAEEGNMSSRRGHILLPAVLNALFFAVALSPVELLGCRARGLLAFLLALVSGIAGTVAAFVALKKRVKGEEGSEKWIVITLALAIPVAALVVLA
jgi:hypothetical protein